MRASFLPRALGLALWTPRGWSKRLNYWYRPSGSQRGRRPQLAQGNVSPLVFRLWKSWVRLRGQELTRTIHDLRPTFASIGADLGHNEAVGDAVLGLSRGKIRDPYIRQADPTPLAVAEDNGTHNAVLLGLTKPVKAKRGKPT